MAKNLKFIPYSPWEAIKWIGKHIILDFYYPFIVLIFFLFITPVVTALIIVVSPSWFYGFLFLFCFFVILVIHQMVQIRVHKIVNIGSLNEDGWREFQFTDLNSVKDKNLNSVKGKNLNQKKKAKYIIGFIGDIMKMGDYALKFEKRVKKFFNGVHLIVGNLEGIILRDKNNKDGIATQHHNGVILGDKNNKGGIATQHHNDKILDQLANIKLESTKSEVKSKWLLCVSNNHSADFEKGDFKKSRDFINEKPNFYAFGDLDKNHSCFPWDDSQSMKDLHMEDINIVTGTMWSNKKSDNLITRFDSYNNKYKSKRFNIFFPHWHYENESYIRSKLQRKAINLFLTGIYKERKWNIIYNLIDHFSQTIKGVKRAWLQRVFYKNLESPVKEKQQKWDLIFGHHSHVPQPIKNYAKGIIGYSGGNFTSSQRRKKHISGLIMKCEICEVNNQLELGKVHWCYTRNERNKKKKEVCVIIDCLRTRKKYFESRSIKFRASLIIFSVALGIWLGIFWVLGTINSLYWIIYSIVVIALFVYFVVKYSKFGPKK